LITPLPQPPPPLEVEADVTPEVEPEVALEPEVLGEAVVELPALPELLPVSAESVPLVLDPALVGSPTVSDVWAASPVQPGPRSRTEIPSSFRIITPRIKNDARAFVQTNARPGP
jgi:hypothetical protein